ncbi:MAG: MauE/DoxX family redox-associated membrane protein [Bacteroidota bacterium]|nr:MauE/DoxX family redox-associated membrane protein [Bacteroidota bacterium]
MKKIFSNKYLLLFSRLILGVIFIVASIDKIALPELFALNVQAYKILPISLVNIIALIIPWMELICGIFLISGVFVRSSSVILSGLLVVFIILIFSALLRGLKIDCGCFGSANTPVSWMRIIEDFGLLLLGFHIFYFFEQAPTKRIIEHS